ncbi:MAG: SRPBCC family protein [Cyclobacteriaceae bacterium]
MPKFNVSKSITIDSPAEKVFEVLSNFNKWKPWSPWLITEPDAKVIVSEDSKSYEWEGKRTGSGNMSITNEEVGKSLDIDLNFLKPWKSSSKVRFELESEGEATKVSWLMDSSLPFFMFWMKKMMIAFIGMDYERGLNMLKEYVETGEVSSKLEFKGESDFPGGKYIGIRTSCEMSQMGEQMKSDFGKLKEYLDQHEGLTDGIAFSIYHKWDMVKGMVEYTGGCEVKSMPEEIPAGFIKGEIPATKIYTVSHIGPYNYLGNAWSALYAMHRAKEFRHKKDIHPFEVYVSDPQNTSEKELITDIHFAVK